MAEPRSPFGAIVRRELRELFTINPSDRPWELPFAVALASGLPMLIGAYYGAMGPAALASIGAMTIVYLPRTPLPHRMATVMACSFAMIACHGLGLLSHLIPAMRVPIIAIVATLVTMGCRYYRVIPPGSLFFVMAAAIGAYMPGTLADAPFRLGLFALGSCFAVIVAFFYSAHILRYREPLQPAAPPTDLVGEMGVDALLIGLFVGLSLGAAQLLALEKPYWVPVSCLAVIQGATLRAVWNRQAHRIVGTIVGLGVTWGLVRFANGPWEIGIAILLLTFCIETAIVRHYAFAAIFITPLTILLAEASTLGQADSGALILARFADTVLGSVMGLLGGVCLHNARLRGIIAAFLRKLAPDRPTSVGR